MSVFQRTLNINQLLDRYSLLIPSYIPLMRETPSISHQLPRIVYLSKTAILLYLYETATRVDGMASSSCSC